MNMKKKLFYETPEMEILPISLVGIVCQSVSDYKGFEKEEDWDKED